MAEEISPQEYRDAFDLEAGKESSKQKCALDLALDIRKFEIGLYWTRATYFWTFIAAALAAFGAVQTVSGTAKTDLSVFLSCLGFTFHSLGFV